MTGAPAALPVLARKTILILGTNAIGAATGAVSLFFIGRYMTPGAYGMFGFAIGAIGIMVFLADIGFDRAHMKRVSEGQDLGDCLKTYLIGKSTLVALFAIAAFGSTVIWDRQVGFTDAATLPVLLVVTLFYLATEFRKYFEITYNALRQTARTQILNIVEFSVKVPLIIFAALAFGHANGRWVPFRGIAEWGVSILGLEDGVSNETGAVMIAGAWAIGMGVSGLVALGQFLYHGFPVGRFRRDLLVKYIRFALPIALPAILAIIAVRVDSVMIGFFWADRDVGHYFAGQRIMTMLMVLPTAVTTLFFPMISEMASVGDRAGVRRLAAATQRMVSLIMVPAVMVLLVFTAEAIHVFLSDSYLPAVPILRVLGLYTLTVAFTLVSGSIVGGFNHPEKAAIAGTLNLGVNLALNFILIPTSIKGVPLLGLKGTGAALATLIGQVIFFFVITHYSRKYSGAGYLGRPVFKHFLAAGIAGTVMHFAKDPLFGQADRIWELAPAVAATLLLYAVLLLALRELGRKDLELFRDILDPGKMAHYVKTELRHREGKGRSAATPRDIDE